MHQFLVVVTFLQTYIKFQFQNFFIAHESAAHFIYMTSCWPRSSTVPSASEKWPSLLHKVIHHSGQGYHLTPSSEMSVSASVIKPEDWALKLICLNINAAWLPVIMVPSSSIFLKYACSFYQNDILNVTLFCFWMRTLLWYATILVIVYDMSAWQMNYETSCHGNWVFHMLGMVGFFKSIWLALMTQSQKHIIENFRAWYLR